MSSTMEEVTLTAPDISCAHCVMTIRETLDELPGVISVAVDMEAKEVALAFDPNQVSLTQIAAALDDAGYPVKEQGI